MREKKPKSRVEKKVKPLVKQMKSNEANEKENEFDFGGMPKRDGLWMIRSL